MITLSVDSGLDFSGSAYRDLFDNSGATAFQHPLWLATLHEGLLAARNADRLTVVGHDGKTGELVLVLPLVRRQKYGLSIIEFADFGVTDYCAAVVRNGLEHRLTNQPNIATELRRLVGRGDVFRIKAVRPEHVSVISALTGIKRASSGTSAHELVMRAPFIEWRREQFSKGHQRQIDGANRRLARLGNVEFHRLLDGEQAAEAIAELRSLRAGRFEGDPIAEDCVSDFYTNVAAWVRLPVFR